MNATRLPQSVFIANAADLNHLLDSLDDYDGKFPAIILAGHEISPCFYHDGSSPNSEVLDGHIAQARRYVGHAFGLPFGGYIANHINKECANRLTQHKLSHKVYLAQDAIVEFASRRFSRDKSNSNAMIAIFVSLSGAVYIHSLVYVDGKLAYCQANQSSQERLANDVQWLINEELKAKHKVKSVCLCSNDTAIAFDFDSDSDSDSDETLCWVGVTPFDKLRRHALTFSVGNKTKPYRYPALAAAASTLLYFAVLYHQIKTFDAAKAEFADITSGIEYLLEQGAATSISLIKTRQHYIAHKDGLKEFTGVSLLLSAVTTLKRKHADMEPTLVNLSFAKQHDLAFNGRSFEFSLALDISLKGTQTEKAMIDRILKTIGEQAQASMELVSRPRSRSENGVRRLSLQFAGILKESSSE